MICSKLKSGLKRLLLAPSKTCCLFHSNIVFLHYYVVAALTHLGQLLLPNPNPNHHIFITIYITGTQPPSLR
ncbi:hypothetical protein BS17DRAFT_383783 [Gyrodon lividus]|nr:hypothetical protein BS17DRAFT_383783 [Gyrodon lividus]